MEGLYRLSEEGRGTMRMIITSECENCIHSTIKEIDQAKIKIYCSKNGKTYYWGQCVPCEEKEAIYRE